MVSPIYAVVNNAPKDAERREAPVDSYGPPPSEIALPAAIYGQPAINKYPPPPPDIPPPQIPHREYGVPILKYGPPKVQVEYGPPSFAQSSNQNEIHQQEHHNEHHDSSFFEQVKQHFGISKPIYGAPAPSYGPPNQYHGPSRPKPIYGPPNQFYGPPKQQYSKPKPSYGPPPQNHHQQQQNIHHHHYQQAPSFGAPPQFKRPPGKPAQTYGPPPSKPIYGPPSIGPVYRPPTPVFRPPPTQYGPPAALPSVPNKQYGPPPNSQYGVPQFHGQSSNSIEAPPTPPEIKCDGWRPIPGPAIPYSNGEQQYNSLQHSGHHSSSQTAYNSQGSSNQVNVQIQNSISDGGLHLPVSSAVDFHQDSGTSIGADLFSNAGIISGSNDFNIIKSEGIEVSQYCK